MLLSNFSAFFPQPIRSALLFYLCFPSTFTLKNFFQTRTPQCITILGTALTISCNNIINEYYVTLSHCTCCWLHRWRSRLSGSHVHQQVTKKGVSCWLGWWCMSCHWSSNWSCNWLRWGRGSFLSLSPYSRC